MAPDLAIMACGPTGGLDPADQSVLPRGNLREPKLAILPGGQTVSREVRGDTLPIPLPVLQQQFMAGGRHAVAQVSPLEFAPRLQADDRLGDQAGGSGFRETSGMRRNHAEDGIVGR